MNDQKSQVSASKRPSRPCPACKDGVLKRKNREALMKWIPSSKYYSCTSCKTHYLRLFDQVQLKVKNGGKKSANMKKKLAIVAATLFVTVYICWRIVLSLYDSGVQSTNF